MTAAQVLSPAGRNCLAAAVLTAALPGLLVLPPWVPVLVLAAAATHWLPGTPRIVLAIRVVLLLVAGAAVAVGFASWKSGQAALAFLSISVAMKWAESRSLRDAHLTAAGCAVLCALGLASWTDGRGMVLAALAIATLMLALVAAGDPASGHYIRGWLRALSRLAVPALLVAAVLFLAFPRIPGPLWNFGLAMGLPIGISVAPAQAGLGFEQELNAGTGRGAGSAADDDIVLVARFDGSLPSRSDLYWRGPVFTDFDGARWTRPAGWEQRGRMLSGSLRSPADVARIAVKAGNRVSYAVRLVPHGSFWLYGLDLPLEPAAESVIGQDLELLSIRKVDHEERYTMHAALDYAAATPLPLAARERALALPSGTNPRIAALGRSLRARGGDDRATLLAAQQWVAGDGFVRDEHAPLVQGPDALDTILFDTRRGGVQRLAEAFTLLLRAAGLPARLVTGYHGGTPLALTTVLIVRRTHAHAWSEVWLDGEGWRRADAMDVVGVPVPGASVAAAPAVQPRDAAMMAAAPSTPRAARADAASETGAVPWFAAVFGWLRRLGLWVTQYDPARQTDLFEAAGFSRVDAPLLGALTAAAAALVCLPILLLSRASRRRDALADAYAPFLGACARLGYPRSAWECPGDHARRVADGCPDLAPWIDDISGRYLRCRYGSAGVDRAAITALRRQIRRFGPVAAGRQTRKEAV